MDRYSGGYDKYHGRRPWKKLGSHHKTPRAHSGSGHRWLSAIVVFNQKEYFVRDCHDVISNIWDKSEKRYYSPSRVNKLGNMHAGETKTASIEKLLVQQWGSVFKSTWHCSQNKIVRVVPKSLSSKTVEVRMSIWYILNLVYTRYIPNTGCQIPQNDAHSLMHPHEENK